ncbi:unnamed protein product [Cylicostephanus goldi]|uniref:Potassium channel tetramerisation-type BTB domain-containing protein n=1 Tax=Cylicostephanus goldi TaxID=71465 RepID=A0A3P6SSM6_CYLGO|nr:unnamed protein product [Cylicostephanus goldi]
MSALSQIPVVLNVGGTKFYTTVDTLRNSAAAENSIFVSMDLAVSKTKNGEVFIDRDPTVFKYILNYLRDGRVIFPDDGLTTALMFQEAKVR